ncbi:hypothetical protein EV360DRAFT_77908 [Lentinula raphanica]|nr:hypothetical protein EV360DRAFT_77908 [Lentinula raphanica]
MHLTSILSQLLIGVWLYECGTVYALPAPGGRKQDQDEWWWQLDKPWIDINIQKVRGSRDWESCVGYNQNDEAFKNDLTGKYGHLSRMKTWLPYAVGNNHDQMHDPGFNIVENGITTSLVVKTYERTAKGASSEVVALEKLKELQIKERELAKSGHYNKDNMWRELPWGVQDVNLFVESGHATLGGNDRRLLVVMTKVPGKHLTQMDDWKRGDVRRKAELLWRVFWIVLFQVYDLARETGMLHTDFDDVLCSQYGCFLIDFGAPSIFAVKPDSGFPEDVQAFLTDWFRPRFMYLFEGPISQAQFKVPTTVPEEWR